MGAITVATSAFYMQSIREQFQVAMCEIAVGFFFKHFSFILQPQSWSACQQWKQHTEKKSESEIIYTFVPFFFLRIDVICFFDMQSDVHFWSSFSSEGCWWVKSKVLAHVKGVWILDNVNEDPHKKKR